MQWLNNVTASLAVKLKENKSESKTSDWIIWGGASLTCTSPQLRQLRLLLLKNVHLEITSEKCLNNILYNTLNLRCLYWRIYLPKKATFMCLRASTSLMTASLSAYAWISSFWSWLAMFSKALFPQVSVKHTQTIQHEAESGLTDEQQQ